MQREIAWMALKQVSTLWVIAMTGVFVAALVSQHEFGLHRSTWVNLPAYVGGALFFPLVAMADALPPQLRLPVLRFLGPLALGAASAISLVLRLPTAEGTPGELIWTVMGTDTVTNLQALTLLVHGVDIAARKGCGEGLGVSEQACVHPNEPGRRGTCLRRRRGTRTARGARFECERCAAPSWSELARVKTLPPNFVRR
jgi:hypothetical protein